MRYRASLTCLFATACTVAVVIGCGPTAGSALCPDPQVDLVIQVGDSTNAANVFKPSSACLRLGAGNTVTFRWGAGVGPHSVSPVVGNDFPAEVGPVTAGANGITAVDAPSSTGTYKFYCKVHGSVDAAGNVSGMSGKITTVQ